MYIIRFTLEKIDTLSIGNTMNLTHLVRQALGFAAVVIALNSGVIVAQVPRFDLVVNTHMLPNGGFVRDRSGFLRLTSQAGIHRFDGYEFVSRCQ